MTKKVNCELNCPNYDTCESIRMHESYDPHRVICTAGPKCTNEEYQEYMKELENVEPLIINVDVGKMPKRSAESLIKKMQKRWKKKFSE